MKALFTVDGYKLIAIRYSKLDIRFSARLIREDLIGKMFMNFTLVSSEIAHCAKLAFVTLFLTAQSVNADEKSANLSASALKVFEYCMDAAIEKRQLTEQEFVSELSANSEEFSFAGSGSLRIELEDNFECLVMVPVENYSPKNLRGLLEAGKDAGFDGRVSRCFWTSGAQGRLASILRCSLKSNPDPTNIFQVNIAIVPREVAVFWLKPLLLHNEDGTITLDN